MTATAQMCRSAAAITALAMVVQPATGAALILLMEDAPMQPWLVAAYTLYALVLAAWLCATILLDKIAKAPREAVANARLFRIWAPVSWGSVLVVCVIYYLMLAQPALWGAAG